MIVALVTGAVLGLSVAAPFGPIGLLCVQRSIFVGPRVGFITGLGASSVHVVYATLAIAGTGAVAAELVHWNQHVRLLSCAILIFLGARVLVRRLPRNHAIEPIYPRHAFASSFAVALCNPLTILPYLLVASGNAAIGATGAPLSLWSVLGVFLGTAAWYATISGVAAFFGSNLPPGAIRILNQVAGALLIGFGVITVIR